MVSPPDPSSEPPSLVYSLAHFRLWLADTLRALVDLVVWNSRKSWFVFRGRRGACPCHDRSDSGRPLQTRCIPAHEWHQPHRFHAICPLLQATDHGWCCRVSAQQIRPYWGRAVATWMLVLLSLYLGLASSVWVGFRCLGNAHAQWTDLAWPGFWSRIPQRQAARFRDDGLAALRRGDYARAIPPLYTASQLDPSDYATSLLLAQLLSQARSTGFSDALFDRLLRDHPRHSPQTALVLHDQLLSFGRFRALASLCLDRLTSADPHAALWERSLYFAADCGRIAADILQDKPERLSTPGLHQLLQALALHQRSATREALPLLASPLVASASPIARQQQIEWLATWGEPDRATILLRHQANVFPSFTLASLEYFISAVRGDPMTARADFRRMLQAPLQPWQFDRLCALILRFRAAPELRLLPGFIELPTIAGEVRCRAALWATALHCGQRALAQKQAALAQKQHQVDWPDIRKIDFLAPRPDQEESLALLLNLLPLPRETIYGLIAERAHLLRAQTSPPASPAPRSGAHRANTPPPPSTALPARP